MRGVTLAGIYTWVQSTLGSDATLLGKLPGGVHRGTRPQGVAGSAIAYHFYTGETLSVIGGITVYETVVLTIKAVGKRGDFANIVDGFERAHELLHRQSGSGRGKEILFCRYITPLHYDDPQADAVYEHYGGRFRFTAE